MSIKFFVFCCLFFLGSVLKAADAKCEDKNRDPCFCIIMLNNSTNCDAASNGTQLKQLFSTWAAANLSAITITNVKTLTSLPAQVFGNLTFKHVNVTNTGLSSIDDAAFRGSESTMETIILDKNHFETFNSKSLTNLKKLEEFTLTNDKLKELSQDTFSDLPNMKKITLTKNSITTIKNNAFHKLPSAKLIDLSDNKLTTIDEIFHLEITETALTVNFSSNQISNINQNAFKELKVSHLYLENNELTTLQENSFKPLLDYLTKESITVVIDLKGNPGNCSDSSNCWFVKKPSYSDRVANFKCNGTDKEVAKSDLKQTCQAASTMSLFRFETLVLVSFLVLFFNSKSSEFGQ